MANLLGVQSQIVTDAHRTMVRATWPSTLKVIVPGGLDAGLLREWRQRRPDGLLVLRHYFPGEALDTPKWFTTIAAADQIADLRPILEVPINEAWQTDPGDIARLSDYSASFVRLAADNGFKAAVGVFSEGNPSDLSWWPRFYPALRAAREHGGYLALHEYGVPSLGFEDWHLLRHRRVWNVLPADCRVPILITECGIDGGIEGRREQGWRSYMDAPAYAGWLRRYHRELAIAPYVHGATLFLCGGNDQWRQFDVTDEVDLRPPLTEDVPMPARWTPAEEEPPMPDWYPSAIRRPISVNYTPGRAGRVPLLIVDHIADGLGSPFGWFNQDRGDQGSSATFWVSRTGTVEQYRPVGDTCWANGPKCQPDLTNPVIRDLVDRMVGFNSVTVAIEHEGHPGTPLTQKQIAASRALHRWLSTALTIPLDRTHVVGHYQFDKCTRANCPGPTHPWGEILMADPTPPNVDILRDQTYALAHQLRGLKAKWQAAGYPQTAEGIDAAANAAERFVSTSKGEK